METGGRDEKEAVSGLRLQKILHVIMHVSRFVHVSHLASAWIRMDSQP